MDFSAGGVSGLPLTVQGGEAIGGSGGGGRGRAMARLLRKHPGRRSKGSQPEEGPEENAMIAATALAVVGMVVVAFLNRIP